MSENISELTGEMSARRRKLNRLIEALLHDRDREVDEVIALGENPLLAPSVANAIIRISLMKTFVELEKLAARPANGLPEPVRAALYGELDRFYLSLELDEDTSMLSYSKLLRLLRIGLKKTGGLLGENLDKLAENP